jgi:seryl-tRNA synthetase
VTINDLHDLVRLLREHPEWQAELRRLILTDELLELPSLVRQLVEAQRRTEEQVAQLTEAQRRTEEALGRTQAQVAQLTEAQRRTEEALGRTQAQVAQLIEAQRRTEEQVASLSEVQRENQERLNQLTEAVKQLSEEVKRLVEWQRGEAGRREGERYERRLIKRAPVLFRGGKGGATELARWCRNSSLNGCSPSLLKTAFRQPKRTLP